MILNKVNGLQSLYLDSLIWNLGELIIKIAKL